MSDTPTLPVQPDLLPQADQADTPTTTTTTIQAGDALQGQPELSAHNVPVNSEHDPTSGNEREQREDHHVQAVPSDEPTGFKPAVPVTAHVESTDLATTTTEPQQSSIPRPADVNISHPSLEELRRRVQQTLTARKPAAAATLAQQQSDRTPPSDLPTVPSHPTAQRSSSPSASNSDSESDTSSDSNSSDSNSSSQSTSIKLSKAGDYKSLLRRRAELAKLLAEAQDQGDSDSHDDEEAEEWIMGPTEHHASDEDQDDEDGHHRRRGVQHQQGGVVHALFQGPATKNEVHALPSANPDLVPLPQGLQPGDHLPNTNGRLRYLGVLQSVIDGAVVVVRQDVEQGGGALPAPRPGQTYLPYGGQLRTPGPHAEVYAVLDTGSMLCLHDGTVVGAVFETFGSLQEPFYSILLPQDKKPTKKVVAEPNQRSKDDSKKQEQTPGVELSSTGLNQDVQAALPEEERPSAPEAAAAAATAPPIEAYQLDPINTDQAQPQTSAAQPVSDLAPSPSETQPQPTELASTCSSSNTTKPFRAIDLPMGTPIYFDTVTCSIVETAQLKSMPKGSDASNLHDEEVGEEEQEYSDDEAEQAAKRARKKRPTTHSTTFSYPTGHQVEKRPRNGREYSLPGQPLTSRSARSPYERGHDGGGGRGGGRGRGRGRGGAMGTLPALSYAPVASTLAAPTSSTSMGYAATAPMPMMGMPLQPGYPLLPHDPTKPAASSGAAATSVVPSAPTPGSMLPAPSGYWPYFWPQGPQGLQGPQAPGVPQAGWTDPNAGYNPAQPGYQPGPPPF